MICRRVAEGSRVGCSFLPPSFAVHHLSFRGGAKAPDPESITTEFAWGDVQPVILKMSGGGYGFRARAGRVPE
jgi:hypothetical protein